MNYESLFKAAREKKVRSAIVGAGEFGVSFVSQSNRVPGLEVSAVCNRTISKAVFAYVNAGVPEEEIRVCDSEREVKKAFDQGKYIAVADAMMLMDLPLNVLVEGTGDPEFGARHGEAAIQNGMHVVMVTKETDSVIGPILCQKARQNGLIYTTAEGDQPSLLIDLITWGRTLGMNIICAGKSSEYDFIFDSKSQTVARNDQRARVEEFESLWLLGDRTAAQMFKRRSDALSELPQRATADLCEMGIVCNATGLKPATENLNAPISRTVEIPEFLTTQNMGGLLERNGVLDIVNCLRRPGESSMAGGVFVVVECEDRITWKMLAAKGLPTNREGSCVLIHRPVHLLGVEAPISVMAAALLNHATGGEVLEPKIDMVGRALRDLKAGALLQASGHHHDIEGVDPILVESTRAEGSNPLPFYMIHDATLLQDIPMGSVISCDMVKLPKNAALGRIRAEQDRIFE